MKKLIGATVLTIFAGVAAAHHSFAMFDFTREMTLQGTVKEFLWRNPHVFIQLLVPAQGGASEEWSIEMNTPVDLARNGWLPGSLKAGQKVTLVIHPLKDGRRGGNCVSAMDEDGKMIGNPLPGPKAVAAGGSRP